MTKNPKAELPRRTRNSVFRFKQFQIDQTDCGMKVSSDATLLGALVETDQACNILDIGTGTGLLALMLAQRSLPEAQIDAVELDPQAAHRAQLNVTASPFAPKIRVIAHNILTLRPLSQGEYDLIVCNPPFYAQALLGENPQKNLAWHSHEQSLTLEKLVNVVAQKLRDLGHFWVLIPANLGPTLTTLAKEKRLFPRKEFLIRHDRSKNANRRVVCYTKNSGPLYVDEILRYDDEGCVSPQVQGLLADYLIHFPRISSHGKD